MNWLKQEEIERRAGESPKEALNVSIEEWENKYEAVREGEAVRVGSTYCGLCQRHNSSQCDGDGCENCCISDGDIKNCCQEYVNFCNDKTLPNAQAMLNRLYLERGKRYGGKEVKKECEKEEPKEIEQGDELVDPEDGRLFYALYAKSPHRDSYNESPLVAINCGGVMCGNIKHYREEDFERTGHNIFDDLERNSEDLDKFTIHGVSCRIEGNSVVVGGFWFSIPEYLGRLVEFHQRLGQLIATAKRKAKKDC